MKPANEIIFDKLVTHQTYLLRLVTHFQDEFISKINKSSPELSFFLNEKVSGMNIAKTAKNSKKWKEFQKAISELRADLFNRFKSEYSDELKKLIDNEVKYMKALYTNSVGIGEWSANIPRISEANLLNYGVVDGKVFSEYFQEIQYGDADRITKAVRNGLVEQKSYNQIVKDVVGTKNIQYKDGITNLTRNNARSLTRTLTMGITNNARSEFYNANSDIIKREIFVATLDGRTTLECMSYDGTKWRIGEGPIPPSHRNCRSLRVAEVEGANLVGERGTVTDTRTARRRRIDFRKNAKQKLGVKKWKKLSEAQRRSEIKKIKTAWQKNNIGRVPVGMTGEKWLKNLPEKFQNDYLGETQAKLFRSGELKLKKFIDNSGRKYNVKELYSLYTEEFKKAGIDYP